MSVPPSNERSRLWSESGEPPHWGLVISLLVGVLAIAVAGIHFYLNSLLTPVAAVAETSGTPASPAVPSKPISLAGPSPTVTVSAPPEPREAAKPITSESVADSPPELSGPETVVASKIDAGPLAEKTVPEVVDPWPNLEAALGGMSPNKAFREYAAANPPRNPGRRPLALCVIGKLSQTEERLLLAVREFLGVTFDTPVRIQRRISISDLPPQAVRFDGRFNDLQLETAKVLEEVLPKEWGDEVFAVVGVTTAEPFPLPTADFLGWQKVAQSHVSLFVLPQQPEAPLPAETARRQGLRALTESVRSVAPLFGLDRCFDDDRGRQEKSDPEPSLLLRPACLHQLCWNLDIAPDAVLLRQQRYFEKYGLRKEAQECRDAIRRIRQAASPSPEPKPE